MRYLLLGFLAVLPCCGCASHIAASGEDLTALTTREQVREKLGEPAASGSSDDETYEDFHSRCKVAEPMRARALIMGTQMTLGLGELIFFPGELLLTGRRTLTGQDIRFTYDAAGKVTTVSVDGQPLPLVSPDSDVPTEPQAPAGAR